MSAIYYNYRVGLGTASGIGKAARLKFIIPNALVPPFLPLPSLQKEISDFDSTCQRRISKM